jgi:hypothetical protein
LKIPVEGGRISNGQRLMRLSDGQRVSLDGQLVDVEMETALARTRVGKISAGYVQELGGGQGGARELASARRARDTGRTGAAGFGRTKVPTRWRTSRQRGTRRR